jgi:hypothetical protein
VYLNWGLCRLWQQLLLLCQLAINSSKPAAAAVSSTVKQPKEEKTAARNATGLMSLL